jgi:hypothetical protein
MTNVAVITIVLVGLRMHARQGDITHTCMYVCTHRQRLELLTMMHTDYAIYRPQSGTIRLDWA